MRNYQHIIESFFFTCTVLQISSTGGDSVPTLSSASSLALSCLFIYLIQVRILEFKFFFFCHKLKICLHKLMSDVSVTLI